ncbi:protein translocase subunit SecF [Thiofaba sp. EF100]|uniref:protein translocase subunit SecF n=1 Tax=Thiofaba sp. EF100 TaxID=3121274 RepID=UPI0032213F86
MRLIPNNTNFDFFGKRYIGYAVTIFFVLASILSLATKGLHFGLDFTGGMVVEVAYPQAVELDKVRTALSSKGLGGGVVQHFGASNNVLVRLPPQEGVKQAELSGQVLEAMRTVDAGAEMRRVEFVGPAVGKELIENGAMAILFVLLGIMAYVGLRFEFKLAFGAIQALAHDVIIVLGFLSFFEFEFDLAVLAGVLAVMGYSINDTIVVFDRIRENFLKMRKATPIEVMNRATNDTLSRTTMTSLTTFLTVLVLFYLGGDAVHGFAYALIVGILSGTYSSIFVASSLALALGLKRADLLKPEKAEAEADGRP